MEDPWVQEYLSEKVIGLLRENGFGYLKVDYNDSIGMGCDGAESPGEGLRRKIAASQSFFRRSPSPGLSAPSQQMCIRDSIGIVNRRIGQPFFGVEQLLEQRAIHDVCITCAHQRQHNMLLEQGR